MNTQKIEAALNLLVLVLIVGVFARFTNNTAAYATVNEASRSALEVSDYNGPDYELDAFELCFGDTACEQTVEAN